MCKKGDLPAMSNLMSTNPEKWRETPPVVHLNVLIAFLMNPHKEWTQEARGMFALRLQVIADQCVTASTETARLKKAIKETLALCKRDEITPLEIARILKPAVYVTPSVKEDV